MKDDALDPPLKLYRAENNLVLHTVYRHDHRLSNKHVNNRTDIFISNMTHNDDGFSTIKTAQKELSNSQMSETKLSMMDQ